MSHDDSGQSSRNGRPAADVGSTADPEVTPKAERRRFTADYKLQILAEADACTKPGEIGALLRREGLYSSHLDRWRKLRRKGSLQGLAPQKRGPKVDPQGAEIARLRRENERLQQRLQQAETTPHLRSVQVSSRCKKNSQRCSAWRPARATSSHDPGRRTPG